MCFIAKQFTLDNVFNVDWEDVSVVKNNKSDRAQLIIADIGDNFSIRSYIQLYFMEEPKAGDEGSIIADYETYKYVFEDGARDAETILTDPLTNEIFIVSKRESQVGVYAVPTLLPQSTPDTLRLIDRLPFNNITAGTITSNGREIVLKNYKAIFYWPRDVNRTIPETLQQPHELINYVVEPQGEAIAWNLEGTGFYTLSERSYADKQQIYFYAKKK